MLRRFRISQLIRAEINPLVRKYWVVGHKDTSMDKVYAEEVLCCDTVYLKKQAVKGELGFDISASLLVAQHVAQGLQSKELVAVVAVESFAARQVSVSASPSSERVKFSRS
jgi:hypothetical protein